MTAMAEARPAEADRWERYAPLSGVVAVALWVIGIIVGSTAVSGDTGAEILPDIRDNTNQIFTGGLIWMVGTGFFLWFLGSLRNRLIAAEGMPGRLSTIAFAGGVGAATLGMLLPASDMAAAISKDDIDASTAAAMHKMGDAFFLGAEYMLPVLLVATGLIAMRYGVLPKWLAWVSFVIALVLLIGVIGWAAMIFGFPIWVLIVTYLIWRAPATARAV